MKLQNRIKSTLRRTSVIAMGIVTMSAASAVARADVVEVQVLDSRFEPKHVTVRPGDTVKWVWGGAILHSTTAAAGLIESWDSGLHSTPFDFSHDFNNPGVFTYYCTLHGFDGGNGNVGGMSGSVFVSDDCLILSMNKLVAGQTTTFTISGGTPGQKVALVYGFDRGRTAASGVAGFCATFGIDGVSQNRLIGSPKTLNPDAQIRQFIPGAAKGLSLSFQSTMQGTCPDICMSNIIEATVQ